MNDRGVDDRAGRNLQPVRFKMPMHLFEYPPAQIVRFEKMAEAAHRGLVGRRLATQINADETRASPQNRKALPPPPGPTD